MLPRDLYGLPLTTTAAGAEFYNVALGRLLRVQPGADAALRAAVRADPDFALAHAGLALLGHEHGVPVDVRASLDTANRAARRLTDREYSQLAVITGRVSGAGPRLLRQHLRMYPRDALMLTVAVPTIAFAGAAGVPTRAWALVEELAPEYGDDWWYASVLAFVRQEQRRWSEAAALADRALAVEPASAHAAHARTHVYYETGDHIEGLAWLDGWIAGSGRDTRHRLHFSWHAALHELAEGDADAVRHRYATQLAPSTVSGETLSGETLSGARLLVDSASLLWRGSLDSVWTYDAPIQPVLDAVDPALLTDPPTRFTALHAALALATAQRVEGLARLRLYAVSSGDPVFPTVLAPLVSALWAYVEGRFDTAAALLAPIMPALVQLGGSAAQREVVEDTLLHALLRAGRVPEAHALLTRRLDRRPSRRDMWLLCCAPAPV